MSESKKSVRSTAQIEEVESVHSSGQINALVSHVDYDQEASNRERYNLAIILDNRLENAMLESMACVAELVDKKLYKELGFRTARSYFETKALSISQIYTYAFIGRSVGPYLEGSSYISDVAKVGPKKLEMLASKAQDQMASLMTKGVITLGDEVYTARDLQDITQTKLSDKFAKMSAKVEKNELLEEQNKILDLERKALEKELKDVSDKYEQYRERSESEEDINKDISEAHKYFEKVRVLINRIDSSNPSQATAMKLKTIIEIIQQSGLDLADRHAEALLNYSDGL